MLSPVLLPAVQAAQARFAAVQQAGGDAFADFLKTQAGDTRNPLVQTFEGRTPRSIAEIGLVDIYDRHQPGSVDRLQPPRRGGLGRSTVSGPPSAAPPPPDKH